MHINLEKTIQVYYNRNGVRKWVTGTPSIISLSYETFDDIDILTGKPREGVVMNILFSTHIGVVQVIDAFGYGSDIWRYKEPCCEQCKFSSKDGGDIVPYGATTCTTPEGWVCDCPDMPENIDIPYDETEGGKKCSYHQFIEE